MSGAGRNFSLQALITFGTTGRLIAVGFLSTVVIGWFSFQIGLTGTTMEDTLGWMPIVGAALAAVLFTGLTTVGIRALSWLGMIATPLFVVLGGIALYYGATGNGMSFNDVVSYEGTGTALTFGAAVGIVIVAGFADSGTMTGDFTRWSTSGKFAVVATFTAFPVSNFGVRTRRARRRRGRIWRPGQQRRWVPRPDGHLLKPAIKLTVSTFWGNLTRARAIATFFAIRRSGTKPEVQLRSALHPRWLRSRKGYPVRRDGRLIRLWARQLLL